MKTSKVVSIVPLGRLGVVRNVTVEKNHTFINGDGIVTHNCNSAQPALRGIIEEFSANVSWILTCNYPAKIIEPIRSRCPTVEFVIPATEKKALLKEFMLRVIHILNVENIEFDQKPVVQLAAKMFPDFRKILNEVQRYSMGGKIDLGILANSNTGLIEIIQYMKERNFKEIKRFLLENSIDYSIFYSDMYAALYEALEPSSVPPSIITLAKYQYQSAFVSDQALNAMACFVELMAECKVRD